MKLVLVESGKTTAVYHAFYKNKLCTYNTADGLEGLMEAIGVEITETKSCDNPKDGNLVDPKDGFPYHLDNLPGGTATTKKKKTRRRKTK